MVATSACLLGMTRIKIFSIVLCVLLVLSAIIFGYVAWKSRSDRFARILAITGTVIMPTAGICVICVDDQLVHFKSGHAAVKAPLYLFITACMTYEFSINFRDLLKRMVCCNFRDRLFTNDNQVFVLIILNVCMGSVLGFVFGFFKSDVDKDMKPMVIIFIVSGIVGFVAGGIFGAVNELETQKMTTLGIEASMRSNDYERVQ